MPYVHGVTVVLVVLPQPSDDERELLLAWLQCLREAVLRKAEGLDEDQVRWRPDGKLISIAGIVNHLAHVEWRWIDGALRGQAVSRNEDEFVVRPSKRLPTWPPRIGNGPSARINSSAPLIWPTPATIQSTQGSTLTASDRQRKGGAW